MPYVCRTDVTSNIKMTPAPSNRRGKTYHSCWPHNNPHYLHGNDEYTHACLHHHLKNARKKNLIPFHLYIPGRVVSFDVLSTLCYCSDALVRNVFYSVSSKQICVLVNIHFLPMESIHKTIITLYRGLCNRKILFFDIMFARTRGIFTAHLQIFKFPEYSNTVK